MCRREIMKVYFVNGRNRNVYGQIVSNWEKKSVSSSTFVTWMEIGVNDVYCLINYNRRLAHRNRHWLP